MREHRNLRSARSASWHRVVCVFKGARPLHLHHLGSWPQRSRLPDVYCLVVGDTAIARSSSHRSAPSRALGRGIPKCTDCQTSGPETGPDQVAIGGHHAQVVPLGRVPYTPLMMSVFMHACQRATEQAPERASSFVQVSISWYARV